jgi:hypothetical protein
MKTSDSKSEIHHLQPKIIFKALRIEMVCTIWIWLIVDAVLCNDDLDSQWIWQYSREYRNRRQSKLMIICLPLNILAEKLVISAPRGLYKNQLTDTQSDRIKYLTASNSYFKAKGVLWAAVQLRYIQHQVAQRLLSLRKSYF